MVRFFLFALVLLFFALPYNIYAEKFIKDYTYTASDADSRLTARSIALTQVKVLLLEEVGVYIESTFEDTENSNKSVSSQFSKQEIKSITAGITNTKILDEKWDGKSYWLKVEINVDKNDVLKKLEELKKERDRTVELQNKLLESEKTNKSNSKEIENLKKQISDLNNKSIMYEEVRKRSDRAFKEMENYKQQFSQVDNILDRNKLKKQYQDKVSEVNKYSKNDVNIGHTDKVGISFQYCAASLKYFNKYLSYEFKYVFGDDVVAYGPRVYFNFNPYSNCVIYVGSEYSSIEGKSNLQKFTGFSIGGFVGIEAFLNKYSSVFFDIGPYSTTLNSNKLADVNIANTDIVVSVGYNIYF